MNKLFPIVLALLCFGLAQDEYPYFSDPLKQLAFEEKRIYVTEESGERTILSGGGSYTELANPLGTIFLDQDPEELSAQGGGGMRQQHHYADLGSSYVIETPPDTYTPNKVGEVSMEKLQSERANDIKG